MNGAEEKFKIAVIGTRGVPARYGGFETCAEELGKRLAHHGHEVVVYCRRSYYEKRLKSYEGMNLVYVPCINHKALETFSHTLFSLVHALKVPYDLILIFNVANGPLLLLPKLAGKPVVLNLDGLEWERGKWSFLGKTFYRLAARLAVRLAPALVADSRAIQAFYRQKFGKETEYIPYGAAIEKSQSPSLLSPFNLVPRNYFLQITRFEPENNPLLTVKAFEKLRTNKKLVLVGGAKYPSKYSRELYNTKDQRIIFPGFIYDKNIIRELLTNCFAYIHGNEAGGTNPALLQAMGCGCFVVARDVIFNREVLREAGIYYKKNADDLLVKLEWALENEAMLDKYRARAQQIVATDYQWDAVTASYESLFKRLKILRGKYQGNEARLR